MFLDEVFLMEDFANSGKMTLQITLIEDRESLGGKLSQIKETLANHPGNAPLELRLNDNGNGSPIRMRSKTVSVDPSPETLEELGALLGQPQLKLVKSSNNTRR
jgi:hypothetical protein